MSARWYFAPAVLMSLLSASACVASDTDRLDAISELEQHCAVPEGVVTDTYARTQAASAKLPDSGTTSPEDEKLIYLGNAISDPRLLKKIECIKSFRSKEGFWFNLHAISPTEIKVIQSINSQTH